MNASLPVRRSLLSFRPVVSSLRSRWHPAISSGGSSTVLVTISKRAFGSDNAADPYTFGEGGPSSGARLGERLTSAAPSTAGVREANNLKQIFYDSGRHRCLLCDESVPSYGAHVGHVQHAARSALYQRIMTGKVGDPLKSPERFWMNITSQATVSFDRCDFLSSLDPKQRRRRAIWLLKVLFEFGVLKETFGLMKVVNNKGMRSLHRTTEFERNEMIGDNVIKYVLGDRLVQMFPQRQGGLNGGLGMLQQVVDSNEGLLRCYEYFRFDELIGSALANSKFKADVVESLFGELQVFCWATEIAWGTQEFDLVAPKEVRSLRQIVEHTMNELAHVMLTWQPQYVVHNMRDAIKKTYKPTTTEMDKAIQEVMRKHGGKKKYHVFPVVTPMDFLNPSSSSNTSRPVVKEPQEFNTFLESPDQFSLRVSVRLHPSQTQAVYQCVADRDVVPPLRPGQCLLDNIGMFRLPKWRSHLDKLSAVLVAAPAEGEQLAQSVSPKVSAVENEDINSRVAANVEAFLPELSASASS